MPTADGKFACPSCGKEYRWKPEMAGRSAKCGCGAKLVVPATPPGDAAPTMTPTTSAPAAAPVAKAFPPEQAVAAPAPAPAATSGGSTPSHCPSCSTKLPSGAVLCVRCGYNLKTGQTLSVVVEREEDDGDDDNVEQSAASPDVKKD